MGSKTSVWLHELSWPQISDYLENEKIVLVPIGATEQHGPHTPLMVDTAWATDVSERAAQKTDVLVAPPVHYGWSPHHLAYPGGVTLRPETLTAVAVDIGESLLSHGFTKIVFVNGNRVANLPPLQIAMAKLRFNTGAYVAIVDTHLIARREVCALAQNRPDASHHAGEIETSFMMYSRPELVDAEKIEALPLRKHGEFASNYNMDPPFDGNIAFCHPTSQEFYDATAPLGVYSDPAPANAATGQAVLDVTVDRTVDFLEQVKAKVVHMTARCPIPV